MISLAFWRQYCRASAVGIRDGVGSSSDGLLAGRAVPDSGGVTLDSGLSAEGAGVLGVLGDFHLLDLLTERGTVTEFYASARVLGDGENLS